jgi:hypothetical protein
MVTIGSEGAGSYDRELRRPGIHRRHLGRDNVFYNPWHYLAVAERSRNHYAMVLHFKQWDLPESMVKVM